MPKRVCGHCRESVDHWTPNPMTGLVKCMACGWATEPECPTCGWVASEDHDHADVCDHDLPDAVLVGLYGYEVNR